MSGDRYEPLPPVTRLPGWIWRRLPPVAKVGVGLLPLVAIALVLLLGPGVERGKEERARSEAARLEQARAEHVQRVRAEQRPRHARGAAAGTGLAARERLVEQTTAAVATDARRRVAAGAFDGPIRRVACEPFPPTVAGRAAHRDSARRYGTYSCLAVTDEFAAGERTGAGAIGHPYRVRIDFRSGAYAYCKVVGRAGEGLIGVQPLVPVARACGGR